MPSLLVRSWPAAGALRLGSKWRQPLLELMGCLAIALVVLGVSMNLKVLNPRFIDWCLNWDSDLSHYYLAFAFYRHASWSFPVLTNIDNLYYPVGASLVLMDGLPLVSVPLKLVEQWLPERIQFFGLWLLLCHTLQAFFGLRLLRVLEVSRVLSWCGAILLCAAAPLVYRHGHTQLCAQWLILASMLAVLRNSPSRSLVILPGLSLWIHAYFMPMTLAFCALGQLRFRKSEAAFKRVLLSLGWFGLSLWVLGYLSLSGTQSRGYEEYVSDVSALFNPMGASSLLPNFPFTTRELEGLGYLGVGGLLLAAAWIISLALPRVRARVMPPLGMLLICIGFAMFAISARPRLFGEPLASFPTLSDLLEPLGSRFRATGRFIWPLCYLLLIFGVKAVHELSARRLRWQWLLGPAIVLLQAVDLGPGYHKLGSNRSLTQETGFPIAAEVRKQLTRHTRYLLFWPPVKVPCGKQRWRAPYQGLALFAAEHGLITNSDFGQARNSKSERREICKFTRRKFKSRRRQREFILVEP